MRREARTAGRVALLLLAAVTMACSAHRDVRLRATLEQPPLWNAATAWATLCGRLDSKLSAKSTNIDTTAMTNTRIRFISAPSSRRLHGSFALSKATAIGKGCHTGERLVQMPFTWRLLGCTYPDILSSPE